MRRSAATKVASPGDQERRQAVEAALAEFARRPATRRVPPPDGRLSADDYPIDRLRVALAGLGPVFAAFGRYLSTRRDLLPRRDCTELALIPDTGVAADPAAVEALLDAQLGAQRFFQFDPRAHHITLWTERHDAWVSPGVPAIVTIVRPDAAAWLDRDLPLLPLLEDCLGIAPLAWAAALADFGHTLRISLDQTLQAAALTAVAAEAEAVNGFDAPTCYRDHCAPGVLTVERFEGPTLADAMARGGSAGDVDRASLASRLGGAWLRQAFGARLVPFDFAAGDILLSGPRLVLTRAAFEAQSNAQRSRFTRYVSAVAADDPDASASWIVDAAGIDAPPVLEEELRRRFRQAVPFRDGEWSGDDRLAEYLLVQWRVAGEAGWPMPPHHLHMYQGLAAATTLVQALVPSEDAFLAALQSVRLRRGMADAAQMAEPLAMVARLDSALREMVNLPQKLDEVLTLAAEGKLRVKLQVPEGRDARRTKQHTILLIANLVLLAAIASLVRHLAPAYGPIVERAGVLLLLVLGGWLLVAAARV